MAAQHLKPAAGAFSERSRTTERARALAQRGAVAVLNVIEQAGDLGGYAPLNVPRVQAIHSGPMYHTSGDVLDSISVPVSNVPRDFMPASSPMSPGRIGRICSRDSC